MKFWWRCALVDTDPPYTRHELCTLDADTRETADKKVRVRFKRMFDRMTTNKIKLVIEHGEAPQETMRAKERKAVDPTMQIFTKEMAP